MSDEARARKARSLAILKAEEVPFIEHLPMIETEAESTRRTAEQVATRALALVMVAVKGQGHEQELIEEMIKEYKLASEFTPKEKAFIGEPNPTQHDRIRFSWRYEAYWVMVWALGYVDTLGRPDQICDVPFAVAFFRENGRDEFFKNAKLRLQSEILDAADLIYRYHWAVRDARIKNQEMPAGLNSGIVAERHRALNWLIMNEEWDDVTTDT